MSDDAPSEVTRLRRRLERERQTRLEAEAVAEHGLRELYVRQQQLQLLEAIAVAANETTSVEDALRFAIAQVCEYTGWPLGHAYVAAEHRDSLRLLPTPIWYTNQPQRFADFVATTARLDLKSGVGLPGRVLETGKAVWIADVTADANFPRAAAARACELRAGAAFPVLAGREVAAVLEFFSDTALTADETLLRIMSQIGTQIGRVLERQRAHNRLIDASHDQLTGLPNRALFLDRLRTAVNRGRQDVSYRCAVLFIDLDNFKTVNDSLGHHAGDDLIVQVASRLRTSLRREAADHAGGDGVRSTTTTSSPGWAAMNLPSYSPTCTTPAMRSVSPNACNRPWPCRLSSPDVRCIAERASESRRIPPGTFRPMTSCGTRILPCTAPNHWEKAEPKSTIRLSTLRR